MTDSNIADLCPQLQSIYSQWLSQCHNAGLRVRAIVTWRSATEQDTAKANGLSNAAAGQSPHNVCDANGNPSSWAFDFAVFNDDASYVTDGTDPRYTQAGNTGKNLGLEWGGDFQNFPDYDHLQLPGWPQSTM